MKRFQNLALLTPNIVCLMLLLVGERRGEYQVSSLKASIPTTRSFSEPTVRTIKDRQRLNLQSDVNFPIRNRYVSSVTQQPEINDEMETFLSKPLSVNSWHSSTAFPNKAEIPLTSSLVDIKVDEKDDRRPQDVQHANRQDQIVTATRGGDGEVLSEPPLHSVRVEAASLAGCEGAISAAEYQALQDLYNSTRGSDWFWHNIRVNQTEWVFPSNLTAPCSDLWEGINCARYHGLMGEASSNATCSVTGVSLPLTNLRGQLPSSIANLFQLEILKLNDNFLTGEIPSSLGDLVSLNFLTLGGNRLTGTIPSSLSNLVELRVLELYLNLLTGLIPSSLGQLSSLNILDLGITALTGPIPSSLGNLGALKYLNLDANLLNGTIPSALGNLTALEMLTSDHNLLTGTIPPSLGNLTALRILYLCHNSLTGPIPCKLSDLPALKIICLSSNALNGTIPSLLGDKLTLLYLSQNSLTGTIPSSLRGLTNLRQLYLDQNSLTGHIPTSLGDLTLVADLTLNGNLLNGTIPSTLSDLTRLKILYLYDNLLTGPIRSSLGNLTGLSLLNLGNNLLKGTIPSSLGNLAKLTILSLNENSLKGPIPSSLGGLANLAVLLLNSNSLTGTVPSSLGSLTALKQLILNSNALVGPIPSFMGNNTVLTELALSSNSLGGTIPSSLGFLASCIYVNISSNFIVGPIPSELASLGSKLSVSDKQFSVGVTLDLSQNALSGTIPPLLFSKQMQTVILHSNCMGGSLPDEICSATILQVLVLDKLTSGASCEVNVPGFRGTFTATTLDGSIPDCIFTMPRLQTLHLSGNGLYGSLGNIRNESALVNVDISNNFLSGSIPSTFQTQHTLQQLALRNNKLSGTLSASFVVGSLTEIALAVNRLSGGIPASFASTPDIKNFSILTGNLFACGSFLPSSDPASASYMCGSSSFNAGLYFSGCLILLLLLIVLCAYLYRSQWMQCQCICFDRLIERGVGWLKEYNLGVLHGSSFQMINGSVERLRIWLCLVGIFYFFFCMPAYSVLKVAASAGVVTEQYTWITSSAFLHDHTSATVITIFTLLSAALTGFIVWRLDLILISTSTTTTISIEQSLTGSVKWKYLLQRIAMQAASLGVVLVVNVLYVYGVVLGNLTLLEQRLILVALGLFKLLWQQLFVSYAISWMARSHDDISEGGLVFHQTAMNVITFILCPFLATLGADSNCLFFAIQGSPAISSSFNITLLQLDCNPLSAVVGDSSVLCAEVPYRQLNTISIIPPWFYSYECTSALLTNYIPVLLLTFAIAAVVIPLLQFWLMTLPQDPKPYLLWLYNLRKENSTCGRKLVSDILLDATVLMTFGLAAPLLGLMIVLKQITFTLLNRMSIGRYLQQADDAATALAGLEEASQQFRGGGTWALLRFLVCVLGIFWGVMVFDMVGDLYGNIAGAVAFVVAFAVWTAATLTTYKFATQITGLTTRILRRPTVVCGSSASDSRTTHPRGGFLLPLIANDSMVDKQEAGTAHSDVSTKTLNPIFYRGSESSMLSGVNRESLNLMRFKKRNSDLELAGLQIETSVHKRTEEVSDIDGETI